MFHEANGFTESEEYGFLHVVLPAVSGCILIISHVHPVALCLPRLRISSDKVQEVDVGDYVDRIVLGFWNHMDRLFEHNVSGFIQNDSDLHLDQSYHISIGLGFSIGSLLRNLSRNTILDLRKSKHWRVT